MKEFKIYSDNFGNDETFAISKSDSVFIRNLTSDTEVVLPIPEGSHFVMFQSDVPKLWVNYGTDTLTVPTTDLDDQTLLLNPEVRFVKATDTELHMISPDSGQVVVSFYG